MSSLKGIPVVSESARPRSGDKYLTPQGFTAVRDGIKARAVPAAGPRARKPPWLKARAPTGHGFSTVRALVKEHRLATVCEEAKCPNIGDGWDAGSATLLLRGAVGWRGGPAPLVLRGAGRPRPRRFCSVDTGNPHGWLDPEEPQNAARTVELMK